MGDKSKVKAEDKYLMEELDIDKDALKQLKKKLAKVAPRSERGVETLFRLLCFVGFVVLEAMLANNCF